MTTYDVRAVFTPTTVATLTFVERERLNNRLVNALWTPGKQIVVYGRTGGGKSTLLENKLKQVYEHHVSTKCMSTTTFDQCLLDAFDQLAPYYVHERSRSRSRAVSATLEAKYAEVALAIGATTTNQEGETQHRMLPPQLTPSLLARLMGEAKACWVLEDFHKVAAPERAKLAQVMKLFMDMATEYPEVKVIAIGAVGAAREVVEGDREMWNRVSEIEVDLMTQEELNQIIEKGEACLNIRVTDLVRKEILHYTNGLPSVCHQLCLNMCLDNGIMSTAPATVTFDTDDLSRAVDLWLEDAADSLRRDYDVATRAKRTRQFDNCRLVVHALARFGKEGATHNEIIGNIREEEPDYPSGNLTIYLEQLSSAEREFVLVHDSSSGRYSFSSPMLHAYVRALNKPVDFDDTATFTVPKIESGEISDVFWRVLGKDLKTIQGSYFVETESISETHLTPKAVEKPDPKK